MVHLTIIFVIGGSHINKGSNKLGSTLKICKKNVLCVVTVVPRDAGPIGTTVPEEAWLVAYFIDTVTRQILY